MKGKWNKWCVQYFSYPLFALALMSCASVESQPEVSQHEHQQLEPQTCVENSKWVLPGRGEAITTSQFLPLLKDKQAILLGEFHDNTAHHQWQLHTLSALHASSGNLSIALEMLPMSAQPALDDWVAGNANLDEFLKASKWYDYWKFDVELYLPILEFARINKVPVYGVNVERDFAMRVGKEGWANIPQADRQGLTDPAPPKQAYLEVLAASFAMHGPGAKKHSHGEMKVDLAALDNNPKFKRFVQGQQLWDRAMAHGIDNILQADPTTQVVGIMGSGHIMNGFGVPNQLNDLGIDRVSVLLPWDGDDGCELITHDVADAVFGVKELKQDKSKDKPKLGVVIENTKDGVRVTEVVQGSLAVEAGVKANDYIVEMAGIEQHTVMEVIEAVQQTPPGRWLPFVVKRGDERIELLAKFPPKKDSD